MKRRELLDSTTGLIAALFGAASLPSALFFWKGARGHDASAKAWADLGAAAKVEGGDWQPRLLALESQSRWRRETRDAVVYLRRSGDTIEAASALCPHTGCLVRKAGSGFTCPCHKSGFDAEGNVTTGPSPRPLDRLACKVERGRLFVEYRLFRAGTKAKEPIAG
jgi:Rieske Fe-S protein